MLSKRTIKEFASQAAAISSYERMKAGWPRLSNNELFAKAVEFEKQFLALDDEALVQKLIDQLMYLHNEDIPGMAKLFMSELAAKEDQRFVSVYRHFAADLDTKQCVTFVQDGKLHLRT
jgi:hypothetical protein